MVAKDIVIGIVLGAGAGIILYALAVQKEEPTTAQTIFSIIGAAAGLIGITVALTKEQSTTETAGSVVGGLSSVASAFRR